MPLKKSTAPCLRIRATSTTHEYAKALGVLDQSVRAGFCRNGHYCGLVPVKLPNGRLRWDTLEIQRLVSGEFVLEGVLANQKITKVCKHPPVVCGSAHAVEKGKENKSLPDLQAECSYEPQHNPANQETNSDMKSGDCNGSADGFVADAVLSIGPSVIGGRLALPVPSIREGLNNCRRNRASAAERKSKRR